MLGPVLGGVLYNLIGFFYAFVGLSWCGREDGGGGWRKPKLIFSFFLKIVFACLQSCLGVCVIFVLPSGFFLFPFFSLPQKKTFLTHLLSTSLFPTHYPTGKEIQEMKEKERKKEGDFGREGRETDPLLEKKVFSFLHLFIYLFIYFSFFIYFYFSRAQFKSKGKAKRKEMMMSHSLKV